MIFNDVKRTFWPLLKLVRFLMHFYQVKQAVGFMVLSVILITSCNEFQHQLLFREQAVSGGCLK